MEIFIKEDTMFELYCEEEILHTINFGDTVYVDPIMKKEFVGDIHIYLHRYTKDGVRLATPFQTPISHLIPRSDLDE